jgi:putative hydrolase of the HAD superfamily
MTEAIFFDFDGLLVDSEILKFRTWRDELGALGVELTMSKWAVEWAGCLAADSSRSISERLIPGASSTDRARIEMIIRERMTASTIELPLAPAIVRWIADAKELGLILGMVSNNSITTITSCLRKNNATDWFDVLVARESGATRKPSGAPYRLALELTGVDSSRAVAFEDSEHGIISATTAKIRTVLVLGTFSEHLLFRDADLVISTNDSRTLTELLAVIDS